MPDISMCVSKECKYTRECKRHSDSGTRPDSYQSYSEYKPTGSKRGECDGWWEKVVVIK